MIFTTQPGVYPSLHQNCHHQILFAKLKFRIFYPPSYESEMWHYQRENTDFIRRVINTAQKELSVPLRIFSVNVTRFAKDCRFGHICRRILTENLISCAVS